MQSQNDNPNNLMLAVVLSMAVLLAWQLLYAGPKLKEEQARLQRERPAQQEVTIPPAPAKPDAAVPPVAPPSAPAVPAQAAAPAREVAVGSGPRVAIATSSLKGSISLKGGRIDDLVLVKYREKVDPKSPNVVLFSPADAPSPYFAEYGWLSAAGTQKVPDRDTLWKAESPGPMTPTTPAVLTWDNGQGLAFRRIISVDANYMFKIVDQVENRAAADVVLYPFARIYRYGTPKIEGYYIQHEGLIGVLGERGLQEITYSSALKSDGTKRFESEVGGWLGITDKYWAAALIPSQDTTYRAELKGTPKASATEKDAYQADYLQEAITIPAGGSKTIESRLYAGAKQVNTIEAYQEQFNIKQFDLMVDWGWFYFITKPLYYLIDWLYTHIGNFGLAILAVTVLVKLAFFPLANKSYESMAKMKKLQPEMERIRDRFKEDKARQQQELMTLYQKQKINPLAGCLPILVQIPVFFALYKVLFVSIDMRHAPFFGWIQDLSAPDPTSLFNLFGLLPFAVPEFLHIGVWPLVMGITMWLQMQLNPPQPDPTQQMVFNWMPVIFTFLLASFPAGLVIYWAWNNILSLTQQWFIMRRLGADVPLLANLKRHMATVRGLFARAIGAKK